MPLPDLMILPEAAVLAKTELGVAPRIPEMVRTSVEFGVRKVAVA